MKFSELVRLLEENGFRIVQEKRLPVPQKNPNPTIIVQSEQKFAGV